METILYYTYCVLEHYRTRWELMASIYIPVLLNQLT